MKAGDADGVGRRDLSGLAGRRRSPGSSENDPDASVGWLSLVAEGRLVLASSSPRRAKLLDLLGIRYKVRPPGIAEDDDGSAPAERAANLAEEKARAVAVSHPGGLILGCDTEVVLDGRTLGKPCSPADAYRILLQLRGRTHEVLTAICLLDVPSGLSRSAVEVTLVTMRNFSDSEAAHYAYSGDPLDKAGAYGIQGPAAAFVERIEGCYYNVVGLPLSRLVTALEGLQKEIVGRTG